MTEVQQLEQIRGTALAQLAALTGVVDMSEAGRSISVSGTRANLLAQLDWVNNRIAQLQGPFEIPSRVVP